MSDPELRPITPAELSRDALLAKTLLALNNADAQQLSWLQPERLAHLVEHAFLARRIGNLDAFMVALDQDARYDSPNFLWLPLPLSALCLCGPDRGGSNGTRARLRAKALPRSVRACAAGRTRARCLRGQFNPSESGVERLPCGFGICRGRRREHP
jgi:hypothetical protein